jgi:ADP-heptose:LPS heptosyltransferase
MDKIWIKRRNKKNIMNIIFSIDGGLGKSVMSTAVLSAMRKQYPKDYIIVITGYPDIFMGNSNVNKVLTHNQIGGIYKNYIDGKECKVFISEPYQHSDYITESKHLIQLWCEMYGIQYNGEQPELFITKSERQYFEQFYKTEKPIMVIQPHGGGLGQPLQYSWTRDIPQPIMNQVIDYFKHDYTILHIKREDQITYPNTLQALDSIRSIAILISLSKKRLFIDSSSMHIAQALGMSSVVTWVGTNPKVFGYDNNINIMANKPTREINTEHNYFSKHLLFEDLSTIPYNDLNEVFDVYQIIESLKKEV